MSGSPFPDPIVEPFGSSAGAGYIQYPIPVPSQLPTNPGYASFTDGFPPATMTPEGSGGVPPRGQDMNGILYMLSAYAALQTGGQSWEYNSTYAGAAGGYAVGAILAMSAGNGFWLNTTNGNTNNPDTTAAATSGWVPLIAYGVTAVTGLTGGAVTLTAVQAALPAITLAGTLTNNLQIVLPSWIKSWRITNNTTGAFTVTAKTASGSGVTIPQNAIPWQVVGDGTNILNAPGYASGSFTGTLTGVTTTVTGTLNYIIVNGIASVYLPTGSTMLGTSNTNDMTMTGVPSALIPKSGTNVPIIGLSNGSQQPLIGFVSWSTGGFFRFLIATTVAVGSFDNIIVGSNFSTSGSKGLTGGAMWTYPLY